MNAYQTAAVAGLVGGLCATLIGREKTRIDNAVLGALVAGFAAYRDPRDSTVSTIGVAIVEGVLWGTFDRLSPKIKDLFLPASESVAVSGYSY
jgi:hypothetical protein